MTEQMTLEQLKRWLFLQREDKKREIEDLTNPYSNDWDVQTAKDRLPEIDKRIAKLENQIEDLENGNS